MRVGKPLAQVMAADKAGSPSLRKRKAFT